VATRRPQDALTLGSAGSPSWQRILNYLNETHADLNKAGALDEKELANPRDLANSARRKVQNTLSYLRHAEKAKELGLQESAGSKAVRMTLSEGMANHWLRALPSVGGSLSNIACLHAFRRRLRLALPDMQGICTRCPRKPALDTLGDHAGACASKALDEARHRSVLLRLRELARESGVQCVYEDSSCTGVNSNQRIDLTLGNFPYEGYRTYVDVTFVSTLKQSGEPASNNTGSARRTREKVKRDKYAYLHNPADHKQVVPLVVESPSGALNAEGERLIKHLAETRVQNDRRAPAYPRVVANYKQRLSVTAIRAITQKDRDVSATAKVLAGVPARA